MPGRTATRGRARGRALGGPPRPQRRREQIQVGRPVQAAGGCPDPPGSPWWARVTPGGAEAVSLVCMTTSCPRAANTAAVPATRSATDATSDPTDVDSGATSTTAIVTPSPLGMPLRAARLAEGKRDAAFRRGCRPEAVTGARPQSQGLPCCGGTSCRNVSPVRPTRSRYPGAPARPLDGKVPSMGRNGLEPIPSIQPDPNRSTKMARTRRFLRMRTGLVFGSGEMVKPCVRRTCVRTTRSTTSVRCVQHRRGLVRRWGRWRAGRSTR